MPVAKTFEKYRQIGEPYKLHNKTYVKVEINGQPTQVRFYSDSEYNRMYPGAQPLPSQKKALGFDKGYITIFKGDIETYQEWFKQSIARYSRRLGWYIPSTEEVPEPLPVGIEAIKLDWDLIGDENGHFKNDEEVEKVIADLLYEPSKSQFFGKPGERLVLNLTVTKAIPVDTKFGHSTIHVMTDKNGNVFTWMTASKTLVEGNTYKMNATVKEHKNFKGVDQTVLTRCTILL